jgi:hypothetical protein
VSQAQPPVDWRVWRNPPPEPDQLEESQAAQQGNQSVIGDRGVNEVELRQKGDQRRRQQRPGPAVRPQQPAAAKDRQQRAQAEQR